MVAWIFVIASTLLIAGCGGGGSGNGSSSGGITIRGKVIETSDPSWAPIANVTVTLRDSNNVSLFTTTSGSDGSYVVNNVPDSTDVYINVSKAGYASINSQIFNTTSNLSGDLLIMPTSVAKYMVDAFYGSEGGASWSAPFYASKSWFGMELFDDLGNEIPNITVTADSAGPTIKYNNGSDVFTTATSTSSSQYAPLIGGYSASSGYYTLSFDGFTLQTLKLPMVQGEITFCSFTGSYTGNTWQTKDLHMNLNAVAWSGTQTVVVGDNGFIGSSPDGANWTKRVSGTTTELHDIVWTGSKYVAVGGTVLLSSDGITWHSAQSPVQGVYLKCVVWTGSLFVAGGAYGSIVTSLDGETWVSRGAVAGNIIVKIIWTGSQFVALGSAAEILTSTDGVTWTDHPQSSANYNGLAWSGSQFVRVGTYGKIQSSADGISWVDHFVDSDYSFSDVTWSGTQFAAVGHASWGMSGSSKIFTSPDGVNWTGHDFGAERGLRKIIWNGTNFIVVGFGTVATSPDGVAWANSGS
jgi:hypothetical protein